MSPGGRAVSLTLRAGVGLSALLLVAGIVASFWNAPGALVTPRGLAALPGDIVRLRSDALIHAGLLLLMLTPLARVVVVTWNFVQRRESSFAWISVGVLLLLIGTTIFGLWGVLQ